MFDCILPLYIFLLLMALSWTSLLYVLVGYSWERQMRMRRRDVQDEGSVGGDEAREATVTVGVVDVRLLALS
jgi:hypothetical protein